MATKDKDRDNSIHVGGSVGGNITTGNVRGDTSSFVGGNVTGSDANIGQNINVAGQNLKQTGGNEANTNTLNINLFVTIFVIMVLALGGLSWAFVAGQNNGGNNPQLNQPESTTNSNPEANP